MSGKYVHVVEGTALPELSPLPDPASQKLIRLVPKLPMFMFHKG
jgi:hypothetical protein